MIDTLLDQRWVTHWPARIAAVTLAFLCLDALLWHNTGGFGLALACVVVAGLALVGRTEITSRRDVLQGVVVLLIGVVPMLIDLSFLSLCIALTGLSVSVAKMTGARLASLSFLHQVIISLPYAVFAGRKQLLVERPKLHLSVLSDWWLALVMGGGFLLLFLTANPVFQTWADAVLSIQIGFNFNGTRLVFWLALAMVLWPLSRLAASPANTGTSKRIIVRQAPLRNALMVFNALFALQTVTDFAILTGGASLPDGMSMADYAHKGAYPLLVTALMAGAFALVVRAQAETDKTTHLLLMAWTLQNILLVAASAVRLELYVADFGLTYLRLWAAVWMGVTGIGLALLLWNTWRGIALTTFMRHALWLGGGTLYLCSFLNFAHIIADHNIDRFEQGKRFHTYYTCNLGAPAILALKRLPDGTCEMFQGYLDPVKELKKPKTHNWRQWGYRNMRILANLTAETSSETAQ